MQHAVWTLALLTACTISNQAPAKTLTRPRPPTKILFHVDTDFTYRERRLLIQATHDIAEQTGNQVQVSLAFDLSYGDPDNKPPLDEWYLTRLDSAQVFYRFDSLDLFLGLTIPRLKQTVLVIDRLGEDHQFRHTAMHEMFHALGVPHLPCNDDEPKDLSPGWCKGHDPGRIMVPRAWWPDSDMAPMCMNGADADAVAFVTHQSREDFRPCR